MVFQGDFIERLERSQDLLGGHVKAVFAEHDLEIRQQPDAQALVLDALGFGHERHSGVSRERGPLPPIRSATVMRDSQTSASRSSMPGGNSGQVNLRHRVSPGLDQPADPPTLGLCQPATEGSTFSPGWRFRIRTMTRAS